MNRFQRVYWPSAYCVYRPVLAPSFRSQLHLPPGEWYESLLDYGHNGSIDQRRLLVRGSKPPSMEIRNSSREREAAGTRKQHGDFEY